MNATPPASAAWAGLAQTSTSTVILWSAALVAVVIVGSVALFMIRRRLLDDARPDDGLGLSLHDLRVMRDAGTLSEEEFEKARRAITGPAAGPSRNPLTGKERPREGR